MILEPYNITIIDLEKDDCSYVNDVIRVGEDDYYRLISGSYKLDKGHFVGFTHVPISVAAALVHRKIFSPGNIMSYGAFVRARNILFLEEEPIFYA